MQCEQHSQSVQSVVYSSKEFSVLRTEKDSYVISFQGLITYEIKKKNGKLYLFDPPDDQDDQDSNINHDMVKLDLSPVPLGPPMSQGHHGGRKAARPDQSSHGSDIQEVSDAAPDQSSHGSGIQEVSDATPDQNSHGSGIQEVSDATPDQSSHAPPGPGIQEANDAVRQDQSSHALPGSDIQEGPDQNSNGLPGSADVQEVSDAVRFDQNSSGFAGSGIHEEAISDQGHGSDPDGLKELVEKIEKYINRIYSSYESCSREQAKEKLNNQNGGFLLRNENGVLFLSFLEKNNNVSHYHVKPAIGSFIINNVVHLNNSFDRLDLKEHLTDCPDDLLELNKPRVISHNVIKRSEIELGHGQYGRVHECTWGGKKMAVKEIKSVEEIPLSSKLDFLKEAFIMSELHHENILSIKAIVVEEPLLIITELMPKGSLSQFMKSKNVHLSEIDLLNMAVQVAKGMKYLRDNDYVHGDLKAANVLVGVGNVCKVADFGYTWKIGNITPMSGKRDVHDFGMFLAEVATHGHKEYSLLDDRSKIIKELQSKYAVASKTFCMILEYCWSYEEADEPFNYIIKRLNDCKVERWRETELLDFS